MSVDFTGCCGNGEIVRIKKSNRETTQNYEERPDRNDLGDSATACLSDGSVRSVGGTGCCIELADAIFRHVVCLMRCKSSQILVEKPIIARETPGTGFEKQSPCLVMDVVFKG